MKKYLLALVTIVASLTIALAIYKSSTTDSLFYQNVEALADDGEYSQANYVREEGTCVITITAQMAAILGIHLDGDATFTVDGKLICHPGGESSCRPIECIDLYASVIGRLK